MGFPVVFNLELELEFRSIKLVLENYSKQNLSDFFIFHYRRGDKVAKDCKDSVLNKRINCKPMKEFISLIKNITDNNAKIYIATNEEEPNQLDVLNKSDVFSFLTLKSGGIHLNSYRLMLFELQLLVSAKRSYFVKGSSTLESFVIDARFQRSYTPPIFYV